MLVTDFEMPDRLETYILYNGMGRLYMSLMFYDWLEHFPEKDDASYDHWVFTWHCSLHSAQ